jgi:heterodisulfide reductase subunit C
MSGSSHAASHPETLSGRLRAETGESAYKCYQCGKCTAGCPLAGEMDVPPSQMLRLLQLGLPEFEEEAVRAFSSWLCLTCETCGARCPKEVDVPRVMEFVRQESLRRGTVHPRGKDILAFYRSFLDSVKATGRLHEVGMIAAYKFRTFHFLQDVLVAPQLALRGKLKPLPHTIKGKADVARIFERTAEHKAEHA